MPTPDSTPTITLRLRRFESSNDKPARVEFSFSIAQYGELLQHCTVSYRFTEGLDETLVGPLSGRLRIPHLGGSGPSLNPAFDIASIRRMLGMEENARRKAEEALEVEKAELDRVKAALDRAEAERDKARRDANRRQDYIDREQAKAERRYLGRFPDYTVRTRQLVAAERKIEGLRQENEVLRDAEQYIQRLKKSVEEAFDRGVPKGSRVEFKRDWGHIALVVYPPVARGK